MRCRQVLSCIFLPHHRSERCPLIFFHRQNRHVVTNNLYSKPKTSQHCIVRANFTTVVRRIHLWPPKSLVLNTLPVSPLDRILCEDKPGYPRRKPSKCNTLQLRYQKKCGGICRKFRRISANPLRFCGKKPSRQQTPLSDGTNRMWRSVVWHPSLAEFPGLPLASEADSN